MLANHAGCAHTRLLPVRFLWRRRRWSCRLGRQAMTATRDKRRPEGLLIYSCADEDLGADPRQKAPQKLAHCEWIRSLGCGHKASLAQLVEHALRKRTVMGSSPIGGSCIKLLHPLKIGMSTSTGLSTRGGRLLLAASTATYSLLWGSSPWPYAYREHALPAELRRPCSWAMELEALSLCMRASPQKFGAHTFTTRLRPSSSALRNSWPALRCRLMHIEPFHLFCTDSACPASSHHLKPPFPGAGNFAHSLQVALSASKRASKHQQQTSVESASSKHVEVMLLTSDNLRWWLHSLTHVDKSRYKWKCFLHTLSQ